MQFSEVVGQKRAKEVLTRLGGSRTLPHALLIAGAEGRGGLPMALALAQYLLCEQPSATDSCGHCPACGKVARLEHADLHLSFPSIAPKSGTKAQSRYFIREFREFVAKHPYGTTYEWLQYIEADNKQGNISAEECRDIIDTLNLKSYEGGYKIQVIWRPEYLGKEGNILLKLIEEPPAGTVIILVAEEEERILATIRSRTQLIKLLPVPAQEIAAALEDRGLAEGPAAMQAAQIAGGSFTEAIRLSAHTGGHDLESVRKLFNALYTNNGLAILQTVEELGKSGREQQKNFLLYLVTLISYAARRSADPSYQPAASVAESLFSGKLAQMIPDPLRFGALVEALGKTIARIERNAHSRTQLLALFIRMSAMISAKQAIG